MSRAQVIAVVAFVLTAGPFFHPPALAEQREEDLAKREEDLAKQLANPVAALISVPFQFNYNQGLGPFDDGEQWTLNFQPVIPFSR